MLGFDRAASSQSYRPSSTASPRPAPSPSSPPPLPRGDCRFILLLPDVSGQRCACQGFRRHDGVPGSSCECGHQACYHVPELSRDGVGRDEYEALRTRVRALEGASDVRPVGEVRDGVERVEATRAEDLARVDDEIRAVCRAVQGIHASVTRLQLMTAGRFLAHEDKIEGLLDRWTAIEGELETVRRRVMAIDDVTMRLEDRMGVDGVAMGRSTSTPSGLALREIPLAWTARVVLAPNQPWPAEAWTAESKAYRRCASRDLVREVAFGDISARSIRTTIEEGFASALRGRGWMPLARRNSGGGSSTDSVTLARLPFDLRDRDRWDRDFVLQHCVVDMKDTPTLYITLVDDHLTWAEIYWLPAPAGGRADDGWEDDPAMDGSLSPYQPADSPLWPIGDTISRKSAPKRRSRSVSSTSQLPALKKKRSFSGTLHLPTLPSASASSSSSPPASASASPTSCTEGLLSASTPSTQPRAQVRVHRSARQACHYGVCSSASTNTAATVV